MWVKRTRGLQGHSKSTFKSAPPGTPRRHLTLGHSGVKACLHYTCGRPLAFSLICLPSCSPPCSFSKPSVFSLFRELTSPTMIRQGYSPVREHQLTSSYRDPPGIQPSDQRAFAPLVLEASFPRGNTKEEKRLRTRWVGFSE